MSALPDDEMVDKAEIVVEDKMGEWAKTKTLNWLKEKFGQNDGFYAYLKDAVVDEFPSFDDVFDVAERKWKKWAWLVKLFANIVLYCCGPTGQAIAFIAHLINLIWNAVDILWTIYGPKTDDNPDGCTDYKEAQSMCNFVLPLTYFECILLSITANPHICYDVN